MTESSRCFVFVVITSFDARHGDPLHCECGDLQNMYIDAVSREESLVAALAVHGESPLTTSFAAGASSRQPPAAARASTAASTQAQRGREGGARATALEREPRVR